MMLKKATARNRKKLLFFRLTVATLVICTNGVAPTTAKIHLLTLCICCCNLICCCFLAVGQVRKWMIFWICSQPMRGRQYSWETRDSMVTRYNALKIRKFLALGLEPGSVLQLFYGQMVCLTTFLGIEPPGIHVIFALES
jgi:hypothetical protein